VTLPRLGFLGLGWIGRHRMEAVAASGAAEVAAVADVDAAAAAVPGAVVCRDLDALLAEGVDGVVIATPSALHAEQSIAALEAGVAVFCQKPLGRNGSEVAAVVAAARASDRLLGVDLSYRHAAAFGAVRSRAAAGDLGEVFAADLMFHNAYGPDKAWFYDAAQSGGGCVIDLGTHLVDFALQVFADKVENISSRLYSGGRPFDGTAVEDFAVARLDFAGGAVASVACSWNLHAGCDAAIGATLHGTAGGARAANVGGSFYDFRADLFSGAGVESLAEPPDDWGGRAIVEWARRLAVSAQFDPAVEDSVDVARVIDAIYSR
jgi:predicted dehydrogenase